MREVFEKALRFWRTYGTRALIWRLRGELSKRLGRHASPSSASAAPALLSFANNERRSARDLVNQRFSALTPLPCFQLPRNGQRRVTVVTDSINAGSLFGGVGTALIIATMLANRLGVNLRLVTRTEPPQAANLDHLLTVYGLTLDKESEFVFLPCHANRQALDFSANDIFITTSWWTTACTLGSVAPGQIWYLLQEDERMFYPYGDDRIACEKVLMQQDIQYLINTKLLFDHLRANGMAHLESRGSWFEPAFPASVYTPRKRADNGKRRFVFYARPNNLRNLFYMGLRVIDAAISQRVLNPEEWDIILVGKDIPDLVFSDGVVPQRMQNLSWADYSDLVGTADLGLSLMCTPHPSYPPLDMAACGAVVVTNTFGNKQNLCFYSDNILCAAPDEASLLAALRRGVQLATDIPARMRNLNESGIQRDWHTSLTQAFEAMEERD